LYTWLRLSTFIKESGGGGGGGGAKWDIGYY